MRYKLLLFMAILLIANNNSVAMGEKPDYKKEIKEKLKQVDISDGVSKEEAIIIAQNYLIGKGGEKDCFISRPKVEESQLIEGCWSVRFKTTFGVWLSGAKWLVIDVNKKTGEIRAPGWEPDV